MNTEQAIVSLRNRITSMNSVPLDVVRVPVAELEVVLQEIQRLQAEVEDARQPLPYAPDPVEQMTKPFSCGHYRCYGSCANRAESQS